MKKNDEFEIDITDIGNDGEGIGRYDGMAFFIKGAVIGDRVLAGVTKLKKTYGYARVVKLLKASPYRVEADCPVAKRCGGCQLRTLNYAKQLEYKENKVKNDLIRLGGIDETRLFINGGQIDKKKVDGNCAVCGSEACDDAHLESISYGKVEFNPIIGMENPIHYRNKGQFPVGTNKEGKVVTGFYANHSHDIIDCDSCLIQHPITDDIMAGLRKFMTEQKISAYDEVTQKGLVRHVLTRVGFTTHEVMVCVVINGSKLPKAENLTNTLLKVIKDFNKKSAESIKSGSCKDGPNDGKEGSKNHVSEKAGSEINAEFTLKSLTFSVNTENTNVIMGDSVEVIFGDAYITDYIGDIKYQISPLSFYQVNPVQTGKLYSTALEYADCEGKVVWDLYCGIGTISLFLAQKAKQVFGVEIVPAAIEDAKINATLNNLKNAEFYVGAAEDVLPQKYAADPGMRADVIVVDPPRKGCDETLLDTIVKMEPVRIVYVSCDPATLSRDIKILEEKGYTLKKVQPVEMFPGSVHVETVCLLSRKAPV